MLNVPPNILLRAAFAADSEHDVLPMAQKAWQCIRIDRDGECNPLPFEVEYLFRGVTRQPPAASELSNLRLLLVLGVTISKSFRDFIQAESPLETDAVNAFRVFLCDCLNRFVVLHERPATFATNYVELSAVLRQLYLLRFSALVGHASNTEEAAAVDEDGVDHDEAEET